MVSSTASALLGLAGWSYIPNFATHHCLNILHKILRSRGHPTPPRGSQKWVQHYRFTFAVVVLGYLGYNLIEASRTAPANLFQILGVMPDADDSVIQKAFRAFARKNHPDRVGQAGEALFIEVRDAYEALKNPITRFAYERFGPDVLSWQECKTTKEYLKKGLIRGSGFYIGSTVILLLMSAMMKPTSASFWRYILLIGLFASELFLLVGYESHIFSFVFPHRVAFQHVRFLHQVFVFLSVALSRVVPVLLPNPSHIDPDDPKTYLPYLDRLAVLAKTADREVSRMLHTELHALRGRDSVATFSDIKPCQPSDEEMDALTREMENMIVEHQLRIESPIRPLWDTAVQRGRDVYAARKRETWRERPLSLRHISHTSQGGLPSPPGRSVSPELHPVDLMPNGSALRMDDDGRQECNEDVILPSPRPSPQPSDQPSRPQDYNVVSTA